MYIEDYPLRWPDGWERTPPEERERAKFFMTRRWSPRRENFEVGKFPLDVRESWQRLRDQLSLLTEYGDFVFSSDVRSEQNWALRTSVVPADPGVAVYFKRHGKEHVLACDKWDRFEDNIAAVAAHIDAIRKMERMGVGSIDQALGGYECLSGPRFWAGARWYEVIGVKQDAGMAEIEAAYRNRARDAHPDNGGTTEEMTALNAAVAEARKLKGKKAA